MLYFTESELNLVELELVVEIKISVALIKVKI